MEYERSLQVDEGKVGGIRRLEGLRPAYWRHRAMVELDDAVHVLQPEPVLVGTKHLADLEPSDVKP